MYHKAELIQFHLRNFLKKIRDKSINYNRLVSFWDLEEKNLITIYINKQINENIIVPTKNLLLKMKAYSLEKKDFFEKCLNDEPYLYKLKRHTRINLYTLREYFYSLKSNFFHLII